MRLLWEVMQGRVLAVGRQLPRRIVVPSQGSHHLHACVVPSSLQPGAFSDPSACR